MVQKERKTRFKNEVEKCLPKKSPKSAFWEGPAEYRWLPGRILGGVGRRQKPADWAEDMLQTNRAGVSQFYEIGFSTLRSPLPSARGRRIDFPKGDTAAPPFL